jgi:hypothetical protein
MHGRKLWVDINRSIQKLPGQGETEFLHWDFNPFAAGLAEAPAVSNVCGKVCYTASCFVAAPRTHTAEFLAEFVRKYRPIYPDVKKNAPKFGLDPQKADPLELFERRQAYSIPAGCAVLWNERLLHGQTKTPLYAQVSTPFSPSPPAIKKNSLLRNLRHSIRLSALQHSDSLHVSSMKVEYGCYLGYFPAGARDAYKTVCGVDELTDRLTSYKHGQAPHLWPSLDRIHLYPARFKNFPHLLEAYMRKMPAGHPMITWRTTAKGQTVPDLKPLPQRDYTPPVLSPLGRKLLGLDPWEDAGVEPASRVAGKRCALSPPGECARQCKRAIK